MSREKLRIHSTPESSLVSNLRGEVGEIVTSWILLRGIKAEIGARKARVGEELEQAEFAGIDDPVLVRLRLLSGKLHDEIIARLSELGEKKVGRLTFHFAAIKLARLEDEVGLFSRFIDKHRFTEKRNYDISHKELPAEFADHKFIHIPYKTLLKGVVLALRLMKKIDRVHLGPSAPILWSEMRRRRYHLTHPASTAYGLMPYVKPRDQDRLNIISAEMAAGEDVWSDMPTTINGRPSVVKICRKWGAVLLPGRVLLTPEYPLHSIQFEVSETENDAPSHEPQPRSPERGRGG